MLIKIRHINSDSSSRFGLQLVKPQIIFHKYPSSLNMATFSLKEKQGFLTLTSYTRLHRLGNNTRKYVVYSSVEPGIPPSGPPTNISWVVAVAIAVVIPFIGYKWGPTLRNKVETAMQMVEDVAEAVEKAAKKVEKVAEDIAGDLPEGGKLRKAIDFIEKLAERTAKDAGAVDDFIDKVQEEEEKAESLIESLKDEPKTPLAGESKYETKIKIEDPK